VVHRNHPAEEGPEIDCVGTTLVQRIEDRLVVAFLRIEGSRWMEFRSHNHLGFVRLVDCNRSV
jgi:hypothetical protein